MRYIFLGNHTQKLVHKYSLTVFQKLKIKHISGSIVESFMQFTFVACQVEVDLKIPQLNYKPLAFT